MFCCGNLSSPDGMQTQAWNLQNEEFQRRFLLKATCSRPSTCWFSGVFTSWKGYIIFNYINTLYMCFLSTCQTTIELQVPFLKRSPRVRPWKSMVLWVDPGDLTNGGPHNGRWITGLKFVPGDRAGLPTSWNLLMVEILPTSWKIPKI